MGNLIKLGTLVCQSEEHRDTAGNDLTHIWASQEFKPYYSDEEGGDPINQDTVSTPIVTNITSANELLMSTIPDLDELTYRRSTRQQKLLIDMIHQQRLHC